MLRRLNQIRRHVLQFPLLLLFCAFMLPAFAQPIPAASTSTPGPFFWLDSLSGLWSVRNVEATLPFKTTTRADSRHNIRLSLDSTSIAAGLDTMSPGNPLPCNEAVAYYINYLIRDKAEATEILLGYAKTHQAFIDTLVNTYTMPSYFRALPAGSSNYFYRCVSGTGASGPWLLPYLTARRYGLRVDSYVDERRNLTLSAQAAFRMLSDMHEIYTDWLLALGAYYCSPATINKAIRRSGGKSTYWEIYPYLPDPQRAFVPALIATSFVTEYYDQLGLVPYEIIWPGTPDTVLVDKQVSLTQASYSLELPLDLLRELNPEYKLDLIPGLTGQLPLRLPEGKVDHYLAIADTGSLPNDTSLQIMAAEPVPVIVQRSSPQQNAPDPKGVPVYYTVKTGDNLGLISQWYDVRISEIKGWNHLRTDMIRAGQRLVIYVPESNESYYLKINKLTLAQKQALKGPSAGQGTSSNAPKPSATVKYTTYVVKSGDNPTSIAKKFPGVSAEDILRANGITDPRRLYVGQKLKIPLKS